MARTDPNLRRQIGEKLRELRAGTPLNAFLARHRLDVPRWNRYENFQETPSPEKIVEICQRLKVSSDWLLLGGTVKYQTLTAEDVENQMVDLLVQLLRDGLPRPKQAFYKLLDRAYEQATTSKTYVSYVQETGTDYPKQNTPVPLPLDTRRSRKYRRKD